jgi:threonine/homoserine/homoserine lactone efflux protein
LSLHTYLIYCGIYALAIAIPGPGVIAIVARALGSGFRATIPAAFGTAVGDWMLMTLCAFGLAFAAKAMGHLFLIVKLAGAAYLIYLGYRYWTTKVAGPPEVMAISARQSFLSQLSLTLGNPKALAFFVALLPTVVDLHRLNALGYVQLSLATFVLIPMIVLAYAALASRVRGVLTSRRARQSINKSAGAILVVAGIGVAVTG